MAKNKFLRVITLTPICFISFWKKKRLIKSKRCLLKNNKKTLLFIFNKSCILKFQSKISKNLFNKWFSYNTLRWSKYLLLTFSNCWAKHNILPKRNKSEYFYVFLEITLKVMSRLCSLQTSDFLYRHYSLHVIFHEVGLNTTNY